MADDVLLFYDDVMLEHDPGLGHPERADRLRYIRDALREQPVDGTRWEKPHPATNEQIELVHTESHVDKIESLRGKTTAIDADTFVSPESVEAAHMACGAAIDAVRAVVSGTAKRAFALVRPPGHHAETHRAMGFCLFNNIAIAAAYARSELNRKRILIVDWDVHHGNGTQQAFYDTNDILFFSTHRSPFYPGTGDADEIGSGSGTGYTVNVPIPPGFGDGEYYKIYSQLLVPIADAFKPDLILVSAGFDAHQDDPLGGMKVTDNGFAKLCSIVCEIANHHTDGRLSLVLEGGYNTNALATSARACVEVLSGLNTPIPPPPASGQVEDVINLVRSNHKPYWPI